MADHIEVIKTLTIPDYDVEMCIVSVSGELFVKSPDFDTRIPYCGTLDLDDGVIAVIMADAYEKVLEVSMAEFKLQPGYQALATIQVHEFETDQRLICRFMGHEFELTRDPRDDYSFGNWYVHVKDDEGAIVCDGWIDDSNGHTARTAMIAACDGAMLDHPTTWPDGI